MFDLYCTRFYAQEILILLTNLKTDVLRKRTGVYFDKKADAKESQIRNKWEGRKCEK